MRSLPRYPPYTLLALFVVTGVNNCSMVQSLGGSLGSFITAPPYSRAACTPCTYCLEAYLGVDERCYLRDKSVPSVPQNPYSSF